ncbi:PAS domain S-box protein [uncultured Rhodospira sp.]|uniref:hybrid sensor histidine kinase/response regulator n=1 Tax=uncultured Rhodospira sp. TaxID=1936189 RepID=UPI00260965F2|nr:PAS domain S-box protein [uncultured Rhodospira sp.]
MRGEGLDRVLDLSPQAVLLLDRDGRIVDANRAAATALGADEVRSLIGTDYFQALAPELAERRRARFDALLEAGGDGAVDADEPRRLTERIPTPDGGVRVVRCCMTRVGADDGPAVAVFEDDASADDDDQPAERPRERRSENRFRNAFDQAPHGMALLDPEGRWRRVNPALVRILDRPVEALVGQSMLAVTHPEDWSRDIAWLDAAQEGNAASFDAEKRYLRPNGTIVWARVTCAMARAADGTPHEIVAQIADITRERAAEDALRASESRFRETFTAAPHGMAILSLDGHFQDVNPALCTILGRDEATLVALDVTVVTHPEDHNLELEAARRLLAGDVRVFSGEKRFLRPDGAVVRAFVSLALARDGMGRPHHFITHVQDITRQVEAEARLHEAIATAEQALLAKTRFLAAASHDLRQPLQALNLFVSVLSNREDDPAKKDILGKVERSLEGLAELMNTLLDISKLEGGAILPDQRPFGARSLLTRLADEFAPVAAEAGLTLRVVAPTVTLYSDPALLEIILRNLIGNALKYTPKGGQVLIGARRVDGGHWLRLDVLDTGQGIPKDQCRLIFEDFHRVPAAPGGGGVQRGGLGLGLGIVTRVARLLGVTVSVDSVVGRGSRFSVTVPCHIDAEDEAGFDDTAGPARLEPGADGVSALIAEAGSAARGRLHMVVVDDEAPVRESLTLLLDGWGHRVSAFAGLSDLTEALLTDTLARPDVMLVDFRLPSGRTGVEAVALARGHFRHAIPALLLTGDTESQKLRDASRGGLPVLRKPVRPDQLRLKLAELIRAHQGGDATASANGGAIR